ncbi:MAG: DUF4124 domain-containing protein [Pseudomonadota bacterium]
MKPFKLMINTGAAALVFLALNLGMHDLHAQDEIYKWVDENGVTHFSARPPEGVEYERISTEGDRRERVAPRTVGDEDMDDDTAAEGDDLLPTLSEVEVTQPDPELVAERCEQARTNLGWLTQRVRISVENDEGEVERISEEERQRLISENQTFMDEWC